MGNLRKRWQAYRRPPEKKLAELKSQFERLRGALQLALESKDPAVDIVTFFDMVSLWHDRGLGDVIAAFEEVNFKGRYNRILENLHLLQVHFVNAGRNLRGLNRTTRGEHVTASKVFLGNVQGLFTHPVSYWVERRNDPKGEWSGLNAYDIVGHQAMNFMSSHARPMTVILNDLIAVAASAR